MNVRDLQISLRPRKGWEAVDLGFLLTKMHYRDLLKIGFTAFLPFWGILFLLCWKIPWLTFFIIWWLKPIYDRFYLHYLSRRIFGNEVTVKEVIKKGPSFLFKRSIQLLTIRRFSPWRSMTLPIHDLEFLKGKRYGTRCEVVKRVGGGASANTTFTLHFCEAVICLSVFLLFIIFIPQLNWGTIEEGYNGFLSNVKQQLAVSRISVLVYALTYLFLEPFYVGAGFCLYLNSRCSQEAWDIELRFKELAARMKNATLSLVSSLLLGLTLFLSVSNVTYAESYNDLNDGSFDFPDVSSERVRESKKVIDSGDDGKSGFTNDSANAQEVIKDVYADEAFRIHYRTEKAWVPDDSAEDAIVDFLSWLFSLMGDERNSGASSGMIVEGVLKLVAIVVLSALVITLIIVLIKQVAGRRLVIDAPEIKKLKKSHPEKVMGLEVSKDSLPEDVLLAAQGAWSKGDYKDALSFLYRGALSKIILEFDAEIEGSDTEHECLSASRKVLSSGCSRYFDSLTRQWIKVAYSKDLVSDSDFNTLCDTWAFND